MRQRPVGHTAGSARQNGTTKRHDIRHGERNGNRNVRSRCPLGLRRRPGMYSPAAPPPPPHHRKGHARHGRPANGSTTAQPRNTQHTNAKTKKKKKRTKKKKEEAG